MKAEGGGGGGWGCNGGASHEKEEEKKNTKGKVKTLLVVTILWHFLCQPDLAEHSAKLRWMIVISQITPVVCTVLAGCLGGFNSKMFSSQLCVYVFTFTFVTFWWEFFWYFCQNAMVLPQTGPHTGVYIAKSYVFMYLFIHFLLIKIHHFFLFRLVVQLNYLWLWNCTDTFNSFLLELKDKYSINVFSCLCYLFIYFYILCISYFLPVKVWFICHFGLFFVEF